MWTIHIYLTQVINILIREKIREKSKSLKDIEAKHMKYIQKQEVNENDLECFTW